MSFAKHYQDELAWLREMGRELAIARPEMARYLSEPGADPDVERLLEGFAFLTGRIREKLEDEFPEVTHGLMNMFCPHYLQPIPSMAIVQVKPKAGARVAPSLRVPKHTYVDSKPIDGTACRFRTAAELSLAPVEIEAVEFHQAFTSSLRVTFRERVGFSLGSLGDRPLRIHLAGDPAVTRPLQLALCEYVAEARVSFPRRDEPERPVALDIRPGGLEAEAALIPVPDGTFTGFRLLEEYFAFSERFSFVDVFGLGAAGSAPCTVEIRFRELPDAMPPVSVHNLLLDCVPAVNLFAHDGDPVRVEPGRAEYRLRPSGKDPGHYEIHTVEEVTGHFRGEPRPKPFRPYFAFDTRPDGSELIHEIRRRESLHGPGSDVYLRIAGRDVDEIGKLQTISIDLTCTNRELPTRVGPGDLCVPHPDAPHALEYRNIGSPSAPCPPPSGGEAHWQLLAHLTLGLTRLDDVHALRAALLLHNFRARSDRGARRRFESLAEGLVSVDTRRVVELIDGIPMRGTCYHLTVDEGRFGGEGEAYMFAVLLEEFLAQFVTLNSFVQLRVSFRVHGEDIEWPIRIGRRSAL